MFLPDIIAAILVEKNKDTSVMSVDRIFLWQLKCLCKMFPFACEQTNIASGHVISSGWGVGGYKEPVGTTVKTESTIPQAG